FDLFAAIGASNEQLDFPLLFASARQGWAARDLDDPRQDLAPLFAMILDHVPVAARDSEQPVAMLVSMLDYDPFLGRALTRPLTAGTPQPQMTVKALTREGVEVESARLTKLPAYRGIERV